MSQNNGKPEFGQRIERESFDQLFLEGPSQYLVPRLIAQLAKVPQMVKIFGAFKGIGNPEQRWADYQRFDWSKRQLPAIALFEADTETKNNENGYMNGTIRMMVLWPANLRRSDLTRIPKAYHSAMVDFFGSELSFHLLDSQANRDRTVVVPGLNELGKEISEVKNIEGIVEDELVPVTIIDIRFRIDLRQFYRFLESDDRTKLKPFERTLADLAEVFGEYDGVQGTDAAEVDVDIKQNVLIDP